DQRAEGQGEREGESARHDRLIGGEGSSVTGLPQFRHETSAAAPPAIPAPITAEAQPALDAMKTAVRLFAVVCIFLGTSAAWLILGGIMTSRSSSQGRELKDRVADLWGQPQAQAGPALTFE